jgi:predicted DsbA family dithiol-disulfide isomerase
MTIRVDVWSDFVCPFCFAAALSLEELQKTHPVEVVWHAFELRPEGTQIPPEHRARIEAHRPQMHAMMRETYGEEINEGPLGITSRPALVGAKFAEAQSEELGKRYHDAVLRAYWKEAQSIDQIDLLVTLAEGAGLDPVAFRAALNDETYIAQVDADIYQAHRYGLSGVPALIFENKYLISGAQPPEVLRQVVDQLEAEKA